MSPTPISSQFPHISHYIQQIFQYAQQELKERDKDKDKDRERDVWGGASSSSVNGYGPGPGPGEKKSQHPLSVSSASSDDQGQDEGEGEGKGDDGHGSSPEPVNTSDDPLQPENDTETENVHKLPSPSPNPANLTLNIPTQDHTLNRAVSISSTTSSSGPSAAGPMLSMGEREEVMKKVVEWLGEEKEDEVKGLLKEKLGVLGNDDGWIDQICLELMHRHKDDLDHVPFTASSITPIRPKSSSTSLTITSSLATPLRPFSPSRIPSFRTRAALSRPQSPVPVPGAGIIGSGSPQMSRTASASSLIGIAGGGGYGNSSGMFGGYGGGGSPLHSPASSPKLSAKALNFSPAGAGGGGGYGSGSGTALSFGQPGSGTVTPTGLPPRSTMTLTAPFSPGAGNDPWSSTGGIGRFASPLGTPHSMSRSSSMRGLVSNIPPPNFQPSPYGSEAGDNYFPRGPGSGGYDVGAFAHKAPSSSGSLGSGSMQPESDDQGVDDTFSAGRGMHQMRRNTLPDEEEDEFSPFSTNPSKDPASSAHQFGTSPASKLVATAKAFDPTKLAPFMPGPPRGKLSATAVGFQPGVGTTSLVNSYYGGQGGEYVPGGMAGGGGEYVGDEYLPGSGGTGPGNAEGHDENAVFGDDMTPLDVLQSVFTSLPTGELEDALDKTAYNFEEAMAMLISRHGGTRSGDTPSDQLGHRGAINDPNRPNVFAPGGAASRDRGGPPGQWHAVTRSGFGMGPGNGHASPRFGGSSGARTPGALKMCRYYMAGECRRSDCRFSHDVDRALCRFWLRGSCAKGDQCEFVHAMPSFDPNVLSRAMSRLDVNHDGDQRSQGVPEEFPDLNRGISHRGQTPDSSRSRFANAVKRPHAAPPSAYDPHVTHIGGAARNAPVSHPQHRNSTGRRRSSGGGSQTPAVPRPSPRIKLRGPILLPTLTTGAALNEMYLQARQAAIKLGQSRNACLARAAEAWKRGDGAAAKRFSREANVLNERMTFESADAASDLVKQRRSHAQETIRNRGEWSEDPGDRSVKGRECAGGLGVIMGIAGINALGAGADALTAEERTEALLDLHMLHASEGADVLEDFLMALEREKFQGLAFIIVGDERHVGTQDPGRGASRYRLAAGIKNFLHRYGYPWSEGGGSICVDPLTHT